MPAAFERCLKHVQGRVRNPYAACTAVNAGGIKQYRKRESLRRKRSVSGSGRRRRR